MTQKKYLGCLFNCSLIIRIFSPLSPSINFLGCQGIEVREKGSILLTDAIDTCNKAEQLGIYFLNPLTADFTEEF